MRDDLASCDALADAALKKCGQNFKLTNVKLATTICELHPRAVFRISRGERAQVRNVFVRVELDGIVGHGEASPNIFYAETAADVNSKLQRVGEWLRGRAAGSVADIEQIWHEAWPLLKPSRAAQCALDVALWDLVATQKNKTASELAWGEKPRAVSTFCTIGLSTREELMAKIAELSGFPFIKIKMDHSADLDAVRFVRERTSARIAVDANCDWSGLNIEELSHELAALDVEFIEQPLPPGEDAQMPQALPASALPVIADESCVTMDDVERMPSKFSGFNIKLVKCGGITPALAMLRRGRALGLRTMVGCMLESSVLISAGAVVAQQTDYADLDGAWLITDDPFRGWKFDSGILQPPHFTGIGCEPRSDLFGKVF